MNRDNAYIADIVDSSNKILAYISNHSYEDYYSNQLIQDAVVRRLIIIGEAVNRLSDDFKKANPDIPWQIIKGFRNILVHEYDSLDYDLIWETINNELPKLIIQLNNINF